MSSQVDWIKLVEVYELLERAMIRLEELRSSNELPDDVKKFISNEVSNHEFTWDLKNYLAKEFPHDFSNEE